MKETNKVQVTGKLVPFGSIVVSLNLAYARVADGDVGKRTSIEIMESSTAQTRIITAPADETNVFIQ